MTAGRATENVQLCSTSTPTHSCIRQVHSFPLMISLIIARSVSFCFMTCVSLHGLFPIVTYQTFTSLFFCWPNISRDSCGPKIGSIGALACLTVTTALLPSPKGLDFTQHWNPSTSSLLLHVLYTRDDTSSRCSSNTHLYAHNLVIQQPWLRTRPKTRNSTHL